MTLRSDHIAGGFFVAFGILVIALSGDLPVGDLSMPGAGFLPKILACLTILFGLTLAVRASESKTFVTLEWSNAHHAGMVVAITALAIAVYDWLGFLTTMVLLMFALLIVIERREIVRAAIYSLGIVLVTYVTFEYVLKTPLNTGPFGF
jgi:Tripartite tricarboxylate transporter TctB family